MTNATSNQDAALLRALDRLAEVAERITAAGGVHVTGLKAAITRCRKAIHAAAESDIGVSEVLGEAVIEILKRATARAATADTLAVAVEAVQHAERRLRFEFARRLRHDQVLDWADADADTLCEIAVILDEMLTDIAEGGPLHAAVHAADPRLTTEALVPLRDAVAVVRHTADAVAALAACDGPTAYKSAAQRVSPLKKAGYRAIDTLSVVREALVGGAVGPEVLAAAIEDAEFLRARIRSAQARLEGIQRAVNNGTFDFPFDL